MKFLVWLSICFILYTYAGYPCLLFFWSRLFPKKVNKAHLTSEPMVSVVIAARNEERQIGSRIENIFGQDYPPEKMEIIIISDGSTDGTNDIVRKIINNDSITAPFGHRASPRLKLVLIDENKGKPNALNIVVHQTNAKYIVFADARQAFAPNAIRELISNFNDPNVGCVSGELVFHEGSDSSQSREMAYYWNLEKRIRKMESAIHSVAGATGAIYAIRKSLFRALPEETLLDDVFIPINVVFQGYRTVFDAKAIAYDTTSRDLSQEKRRKVRTLLGNYQLLQIMPSLLSPNGNPIFFRYLSHKVFRLFVPFFFLILILSSFMTDGLFYKLTFMGSVTAIALTVFDKALSSIPYLNRLSKMSRTFIILNYFALLAFFYFVWPKKRNVW